jgi:4-hydroxy-tetrahydrodipicolinate synthase
MTKNFESIPVMLTPLKSNGNIDYDGLVRLTEFYIETGATGLFTNCLSGEMFELSAVERLQVTQAVVDQVNGRLPVLATGTFGHDQDKHIDFIKEINDTGVNGVILNSNQMAYESQSDDEWKSHADKIVTGTVDIDFGVYECPVPYKRLLSPALTKWLGETGRFKFIKETSCDMEVIKLKLAAVVGSQLGIYNANIATGLSSIQAGAKGFASTASNFYPEFINFFSESSNLESKAVKRLNAFITVFDELLHISYPLSAKYFLQKRGMDIELFTRGSVPAFTTQDYIKFDQLYYVFETLAEELEIDIYKW